MQNKKCPTWCVYTSLHQGLTVSLYRTIGNHRKWEIYTIYSSNKKKVPYHFNTQQKCVFLLKTNKYALVWLQGSLYFYLFSKGDTKYSRFRILGRTSRVSVSNMIFEYSKIKQWLKWTTRLLVSSDVNSNYLNLGPSRETSSTVRVKIILV